MLICIVILTGCRYPPPLTHNSEINAKTKRRVVNRCGLHCYKPIEDRKMDVKIEINTGVREMPEHATIDEVLAARISEQERILNALEIEKSRAAEKKAMLESIVKEATRPRSTGL